MSDKEEIKTTDNKPIAAKSDEKDATKENAREITTKEAYFASLNEWVKRANISQNAMAMFPMYLMSCYPQLFSPQPATVQQQGSSFIPGLQVPTNSQTGSGAAAQPLLVNPNVNAAAAMAGFNGFRIMNEQSQADLINQTGGYEYVVASLWKRAIAELIDMVIMLFLKIVTIFVVTNVFGYNIMLDMDKEVLNKAMENEDFGTALIYSLDFLAFSSDLLAFEIATKLFVCLYEAVLTTYFDGASLGKHVMGLSVKYCEAMVLLPPNVPPAPLGPQMQLVFQTPRVQIRALLYPAETPKFKRAFMRAVAKNLILSLLFPMFFLMAFFKNNRTAYDVMTKTIVVESSRQTPVLRRPQQQQQQ
ncbi:protein FAM8A1 [Musca vetustissima]|uniref:protein FAM8A1 n=1 Tax=Musca vetustissima TaxID=27455 RepID=UPI002AB7A192|nr:protein FAM8A1 [Musca vetustissima]